MTRFTPKLGHDPAYMKDPDPRSEPIPFVLTPFERDEAKVFALQAEMRRRSQNIKEMAREAQFGRNVDGLEVGEVLTAELSPEERRSFNL